LGLDIQRPEAAIADSSRLVVRDIIPTYVSADSFLESAKFKLDNSAKKGKDTHGGFKKKRVKKDSSQIVKGLGNENITGLMPLYLFWENWSISKRKI